MVGRAGFLLFAIGLLAACNGQTGAPVQLPVAAACFSSGYSAKAPEIDVTWSDDGSVVTAPLCASLWVRLGPAAATASDESILAPVPYPIHDAPLPGPPIFLAKHTG